MAVNLYFISGLPGSGKSHFAKEKVAAAIKLGKDAYLLDDPLCDVDEDTPLNDARRLFAKEGRPVSYLTALRTAVESGADSVYVACPFLCGRTEQEWILDVLTEDTFANKVEVNWFQFENDQDACFENLERRGDLEDVLDFAYEQSSVYHFRPEAVILPVWTEGQ